MRQLRVLLVLIVAFLGISFTTQVVHAEGMGGPNTGDYVYEDREYVTNEQYGQLSSINNQIYSGVSPQRLYILIFDNSTDVNSFVKATGTYPKRHDISSAIVDKTGEALYGHDHFYDMVMDYEDGGSLMADNNYLIMNLKDNRVYFNPSLQASLYVTDLMFWRLQQGLGSKLKSSDTETKVSALFELAQRMGPKLVTVSEHKKMLKSTSMADVKRVINNIEIIVGAIVILFVILLIVRHNKNHPGPSDPSYRPDYDAGLDEGYYYGSHDPFM